MKIKYFEYQDGYDDYYRIFVDNREIINLEELFTELCLSTQNISCEKITVSEAIDLENKVD